MVGILTALIKSRINSINGFPGKIKLRGSITPHKMALVEEQADLTIFNPNYPWNQVFCLLHLKAIFKFNQNSIERDKSLSNYFKDIPRLFVARYEIISFESQFYLLIYLRIDIIRLNAFFKSKYFVLLLCLI